MKINLRTIVIIVLVSLVSALSASVESLLYDDTMLRLEREIQQAVKRQAIIAHNIANAEVEGYRPIRFQDEIAVLEQRPGGYDPEKDEVIIEEEMVKMSKNRLRHQALIKLYSMKMQTVNQVMSQGR